MVLARSSGSTFFEDLVDRAIDLRADIFEEVDVDASIALVASGEPGKLAWIKQLVGTLVPYTLGVVDAGTALGFAIAAQPDLAVIDSDLEIANGIDMTLSFPTYAPRTKALVLTDDSARATDLRLVGFDAGPRNISDFRVLDWLTKAMAEVR